jgi:Ala-tRNA(Pro) deacylase
MDIFEYLRDRAIPFERCDHVAVFTAAEAEQHVPPLPGAKAKNLFVHDRKSGRCFLLVVPYAKRVDLRALARAVGSSKLAFGSAELLLERLGITPGAVSVLALCNDRSNAVDLIVDASTWAAEALQCHPLVNTATVVIAHEGLERFLAATGHTPRVIDVPSAA